jgi:hypothetical protein
MKPVYAKQLPGETPPDAGAMARLLASSLALQKLEPWRHLADSHLFAVEVAPGRVYYAQILGNASQLERFQIYLGPEGYWLVEDVFEDVVQTAEQMFSRTLLVWVEFAASRELTPADKDALRAAGGKVTARGKVPQWRAARPCCLPWYPDANEVEDLIRAIDLSLPFLASDAPQTRKLWTLGSRLPWIGPDGTVSAEPVPHRKNRPAEAGRPCPVDESEISKLPLPNESAPGLTIELTHFLAPMPIASANRRPMLPRIAMGAEARSGFLFHPELGEAQMDPGQLMAAVLLKAIHVVSRDARIREVHVGSEADVTRLQPLCDRLGIKLARKRHLHAVEHAAEALRSSVF